MKKVITILALALTTTVTFAQDTPLEITGSADLYYKYDFSEASQLGTSFATDQNSVSLGMIDIALKKKTGKTSFVGEVSFGPRGQFQSILNSDGTSNNVSNSFVMNNIFTNIDYEAMRGSIFNSKIYNNTINSLNFFKVKACKRYCSEVFIRHIKIIVVILKKG
jgi:hypothetical protein